MIVSYIEIFFEAPSWSLYAVMYFIQELQLSDERGEYEN